MWAACLWDHWESPDGRFNFNSFAILTDVSPPEIQAMGHDRCPIYLKEEQFSLWPEPKNQSKSTLYEILNQRENINYEYTWIRP